MPKIVEIKKETVALVIEATKSGVAFSAICSKAGVPRSTLQLWIKKGSEILDEGREPEGEKEARMVELALGYERARGEYQTELVSCIRLAARGRQGRGDWKAAAFLLERRFQDEWCRLVSESKREGVELALEALREMMPEDDFVKLRRQIIRRVSES